MKSPTSIVSTLLESDYVDYDPNLDPFSDPKNVSDEDLGYVYISREDMMSLDNWTYYLVKFGLIGKATVNARLPRGSLKIVYSVDRVCITSSSDLECEAHLALLDLTISAEKRVTHVLGKPDRMLSWPVKFVSVEYK